MIGAILMQRQARKQFALLNARDLDGFMQAMADDVVFDFPGQTTTSGHHVGKVAVRAFFDSMLVAHPEVRFTLRHVAVEDIFSMSGTNTVLIEWDLDYTDVTGRWFHNSGVTSGSAKGGKVVRLRDFVFDWVALAEANAAGAHLPA
jgi:ketosteroid isomerase-like protein